MSDVTIVRIYKKCNGDKYISTTDLIKTLNNDTINSYNLKPEIKTYINELIVRLATMEYQ